ncbi:acyl-CoA carboxylase subunit beta [Couchioplanes caeruleus]|uniref:Propionyl-CoA carboxylase subunit beta n=2 Tax=Couchioplanes caeruleus TaxID=56438 RepID=A0A1K0GUT0_9ACTN|nr:carboxyl transferase domain-containing protein [Couchioplanes caeruleus]OJF16262.1 propionyl-CoA carboxylase subunit beta [Couchioplanes caeruleus subsp. caeruleus]ROP28386.1 acetyl-CoA/propionyl-CoA carboxylase carboxyl transferase subunit [Couchioplanes caeruleus]
MTAVINAVEKSVDVRDPLLRIRQMVDVDTETLLHDPDDLGVLAARGRIDGLDVVVFCTDGTRMGGAMGSLGCRRIAEAIDLAVEHRVPVIGIWHSGGARLAEGVMSMDGVGHVFAAMVRASGRVPQLSVVVGPAAGGAAYGPALTDVVIMSDAGRIFVTGPDVVRSVTGEEIDQEGLGGPVAHGRHSGVAHIVAGDEADAYRRCRRLAVLLARPGRWDLSAVSAVTAVEGLPENTRRAYDVRPVVKDVLDGGSFEELQAKWAPNIVTGFGRLAGHTVGVVANNPLRKGGCLDSLSAEKASRFVRLCDAFAIPLVVLVDVPGYLPGVDQELGGVVRRGAKLLHAFAEAVVPRVTLYMRKSYGGAYIAMNSRSLGATRVLAWPGAEVAVMGAKAAVGILKRRELAACSEAERPELEARLIAEHEAEAGGVDRAVELGLIDEVIEPARTRSKIAEALAQALPARGVHGNIPL